MKSVMIVDDEQDICESLAGILEDEGFHSICAADGETALTMQQQERPDLVLLDIWLPTIDGLEVLKRIKQHDPDQLVIMMSGHGTIETAVQATKLGAHDFIEKPLSLDKVLLTIDNACRLNDLVEENKTLKQQIHKNHIILGTSPAIEELKEQIRIAAPTSGWVLITGENGTGKELVARQIHQQSKRSEKPFIEVNCAAIPEDLIESDLFGHEKGAFTGATSHKKGKFDMAHQGTLFLDEIGDMSLKTQSKILRILQEKRFERVGGTRTIEVDVRVIAATNKNLSHEIAAERFREDLFYRLNVLPFYVPPLRERLEDINILFDHFLKLFAAQEGITPPQATEAAIKRLQRYSWPGNVRELKNLAERLVIMNPNKDIEPEHIDRFGGLQGSPDKSATNQTSTTWYDKTYKEAKDSFEREYLYSQLQLHDWNISKTAESIGLERSNLHRKIKAYGLDHSET